MGVDLNSWRMRIGSFYHPGRKKFGVNISPTCGGSQFKLSVWIRLCMVVLLVVSMSVEINPGPKTPRGTSTTDMDLEPSQKTPRTTFSFSASSPKKSQQQKVACHVKKKYASPVKTRTTSTILTKPKTPPPSRKRPWTQLEEKFLVQYAYVNNPGENKTKWWQTKDETYWQEAAKYIKKMTKSKLPPRTASQVRSRLTKDIKALHPSIPTALAFYGIPTVTDMQQGLPDISALNSSSRIALALKALMPLETSELSIFIRDLVKTMEKSALQTLADQIFFELTKKLGLGAQFITDFASLSANAMITLHQLGKSNLMHKFAKCISEPRPNTDEPLMPLTRMPFGLIEYQIEFFSSIYTTRLRMPDDFQQWLNVMEMEFGTRFNKLFRGPGWSGRDRTDYHQPITARMNVACVNHGTITQKVKEQPYSTSPEIQIEVLKNLKKTNPNGRWWLKIDGTDIKPAIQESVKGEWNGDIDLQDGSLQKLRQIYDNRLTQIERNDIISIKDNLKDDNVFLREHLNLTVKKYKEKYKKDKVSEQKLKEINWEILETTELMNSCQNFLKILETGNCSLVKEDLRIYNRDLFKKKRQPAATHVLIIMISDEQRKTKPYAQPIQYIPYHSMTDEVVQRLTSRVKEEMVKLGMTCVGTVTDGEFSTLRTKGMTREVHLYEIIRKVKMGVNRLKEGTMKEILTKVGETDSNTPIVLRPDKVPDDIINKLDYLKNTENKTLMEALQIIRQSLVPPGYIPQTWRKHIKETCADAMRSIIATFRFRDRVKELKTEYGIDFSDSVYIPEFDTTTNSIHHHREDHNHLVKRIARHLRSGGVPDINLKRYDEAVTSDLSNLTYTALTGQRKQNVHDAELLLSYSVADFFMAKGYGPEEKFTRIVAEWHEASDGRGMSQNARQRANKNMLNMILDQWMPWHRDNPDLSLIDINVRLDGLNGFSRETVIGITTNICSQELRRSKTKEIGHDEHPRAGSTDDVECFFSLLHHVTKGQNCTLKEFKYWWLKLVNQFVARIDPDLKFYYWTSTDRYSTDDQPSFDVLEEGTTLDRTRLHRLQARRREDSSIVVGGRSFLPVQHRPRLRTHLFANAIELPPVQDSSMQQQVYKILGDDS